MTHIVHLTSFDNDLVVAFQCFVIACGAMVLLSGVLSNSKTFAALYDYTWLAVAIVLFIVLPVMLLLGR